MIFWPGFLSLALVFAKQTLAFEHHCLLPRLRPLHTRSSSKPAFSALSTQQYALTRKTCQKIPCLAAQQALVDPPVEDAAEATKREGANVETEIIPTNLMDALRVFFLDVYNGPRVIVVILTGMVAQRSVWSPQPLTGADVVVAVSAIVFWWFQEHFLHKHLLHSSADWLGKEIHEGHHAKPYYHISIDPGKTRQSLPESSVDSFTLDRSFFHSIHLIVMAFLSAGLMLGWLGTVHIFLRCILPLPLALSATVGYAAAGLWYEYLHFIVHTRVKFRPNSYWQAMKVHHTRHHLVDKNNWLGFSVPAVDSLFGTNPTIATIRQLRRDKTNR